MGEIVKYRYGVSLPGEMTRTSLTLPQGLSFEQWLECGLVLARMETAVYWWLGDWWAYGEHAYGERKALFEEGGSLEDYNFQTVANYGWVANSVRTSVRTEVLSWKHHLHVAALSPAQQRKWLKRAIKGDDGKPWSAATLRAKIAFAAALKRTKETELEAEKLGKFVVLYADPPWQYEHPPIGGTNRSIERHYPTMTLEKICTLPVGDIAYEDCILFLWATSPKLSECMQVLGAWGFEYRTDWIWRKDKIGMGYHVRDQHETLLIAKRGALAPPAPEDRPLSVIDAPREEHSAKPEVFRDLIDKMYPKIRKLELFARDPVPREWWSYWGNQVEQQSAA